MSSQYAPSKSCQLFHSDLEGVLRLPSHLLLSTKDEGQDGSEKHGQTDTQATVASLTARAVLTGAHVRGLVVDAPVRVAISAKKRDALILGNPFIQSAVTRAMAAAAGSAKGDGSGGGGGASGDREAYLPTHRVGRVVALLPKPGAAAASAVPTDWLLAVHLGDCTELFPLAAVSEEPFSEQEHQVYVQTTVAGNGGSSSSSSRGVAALLSGEQAEALKRRLVELRMALLLALGVPVAPRDPSSRQDGPKGGGTAQGPAAVSDAEVAEQRKKLVHALAAAAATRKRPRDEEDEDGDRDTTDAADALSSPASSSHAIEVSRLQEIIARQSAQLQALRQLIQKKEADIAAILQQQQQGEQQHAAEVGQLRSKAEEEARARERGLRETAEQLRDRDSKLQAAGEKLRSVAEMAAKYKKVYHELLTSALSLSAEEARTMKPEEATAMLRARKPL